MQQNKRDILESYIEGKDADQAQILEQIYSRTSEVTFEIIPDTISFPAKIHGNKEIAYILSRDFNKKHDHVKTYYLSEDQEQSVAGNLFGQQWLVLMRDKETREIKMGTGLYDWYFTNKEDDLLKISRHKITIGVMLLLDSEHFNLMKRLQSHLPYPWVSKQLAISLLGEHDSLKEIVRYLASD